MRAFPDRDCIGFSMFSISTVFCEDNKDHPTFPDSSIPNDCPKLSSPMMSVVMNSHHLNTSATPRDSISWQILVTVKLIFSAIKGSRRVREESDIGDARRRRRKEWNLVSVVENTLWAAFETSLR
jgi:hypothetical protein